MVSAGIVLIAAPLGGLCYLLCNGNQILITQTEYETLSATSMQFARQRDQTILHVLKTLPWLLGVLILIGLVCLIYGGIKWQNIQKEIDEQTKLKTKEQRVNVDKMSASEIAEKVIDEVAHEHVEQVTTPAEVSFEKAHIAKVMEIENLCYTYIRKQYSKNYDVQQNVKLDSCGCDILAISKNNEMDYLFEIKYWIRYQSISLLHMIARRMKDMKTIYESKSQRDCKCTLMIVTLEETKEDIQNFCNGYINEHSLSFDIRVNTEEDLK